MRFPSKTVQQIVKSIFIACFTPRSLLSFETTAERKIMKKLPNQLHYSQKLISNSFRVNLSKWQTEFINYPLQYFLFCGSLEVFDLLSHALYIYSHCLGKVYLILRGPLTANCYLLFYLFHPKIFLRYRKISNDQRFVIGEDVFVDSNGK